ncbi:pre-60S factor rei1 [Elasticomyces elasticus]|nr:pre-60S factor rei1 [Elasticomyces elasticus]
MRDRGHCMIAYNSEEEQMDIGEFYDFRSTYSDEDSEDEEEEQVNGGVNLGVKRAVKTTVQGEDGENVVMEDDEDWESDSTGPHRRDWFGTYEQPGYQARETRQAPPPLAQ